VTAILEIINLTRRFGGLVAVDSLDLSVEDGAIWAIIGPNGAGKTTAFNVVTGFYRPSSGSVRFAGADVTHEASHRLVKRGIARTFQNIRLFPLMTALENVATGAHSRLGSRPWHSILGTPGCRREEREVERSSMALLERVGLADDADTLAAELPYGSQRRLEIARALATEPRLLMLDEPAAGANPRESEVLVDLIRSIRDSGVTVVLIEHDMSVVMRISDRVTVLDHGRKIAEGTPEEIRNNDHVIEAYLGRPREEEARVVEEVTAAAEFTSSGAAEAGPSVVPVVTAVVGTPDASPAKPRVALELRDLRVSYGAIEAVKGIDVVVHEGEVVTLIGANGAGKTTTLKAIAGILRLRGGEIHLFGERVDGIGSEKMVRRGVVLAPEGRQIFGRMSVRENLLMGGYLRSDEQGIRDDIDYVFGLFPLLAERREQLGGTLSGGEQQMLAIGRALMARPKVLMLDEPSMGLAPVLVQQTFDIIARLHAEGRTILLVEQNALMALTVASRGYVLRTGTVAIHDTAANLVANEQVRDAYLGGSAQA
jgi:branched-chain amino acid transport system ATP-binding protein